MTIETLTDAQRLWLTRYRSRGPGILRIIDALAAERAALVAQVAELTLERDEAIQRIADLESVDERGLLGARVSDLESEVARLQAALAAAEKLRRERDEMWGRRQDSWRESSNRCLNEAVARAEAAEARVRELEARIEKAIGIAKVAPWDEAAALMVEVLRGK